MSITSRVETITAAEIIEAGVAEGKIVMLRNPTATIFLGGPDVTIANGFPLEEDDILSITLLQGDTLYGVTAATGDVNVLVTRDQT